MKQKIICWIAVVAGAYAVKGLLLPIVAAMLAGGQESVTMMSYALHRMRELIHGLHIFQPVSSLCQFL